jgi:SAM-dependent methyltransferase
VEYSALQLLLSPAGQEVLEQAAALQPREPDFLKHFDLLSRRYPAELAKAALEVAILRQEAVVKFPNADKLYFTRQALEQATAFEVASYRVQRFAGLGRLLDLGCSIGGDTLALAALAPVIGVDLDPVRLGMARANLAACGQAGRADFVQADLTARLPLSLPPGGGLFFDPARRSAERRVFSVHDYRPPLSMLEEWLPHTPAAGVKLSPGVRLDELKDYPAEIEFISLKGELKEAVLWFGPLRTAQRRATVLPGPHSLWAAPGSAGVQSGLPLSPPRLYLYEPDPAILRAGLVQALGEQLQAAQLDPDIAYLTADHRLETPFARSWQVEAWFPFSLKRLRLELRQRGVTQVVVKKRGSPLQPEALIRSLRLKEGDRSGRHARVIFLTHLRGQPVVVLCLP